MPCYLFSYHAFGSWLPDRGRGYVHRGDGIRPPDRAMANRYRSNMKQDEAQFRTAIPRILIEESLLACEHQRLRCHFVATETTHAHLLVSWTSDRQWQLVRAKLRESLSRRLNREIQSQEWFSKSPSRKRVKDRRHFDYLTTDYLVKHTWLKWAEGRGIFA